MLSTIALCGCLMLAAEPLGVGDHTRRLDFGGLDRSYLVHVPPKYNSQTPTPLVLVFHGGGSHAEQMVRFCGMNETADTEGFIVAYPNGIGLLSRFLTFNGGNCCGYAMTRHIDDVGFTAAVLDDLADVTYIDVKRVYATGMSNGAIMSYRLASELSDRIAAIAPVGGPMGTETCSPKRAVSVIHFHGTEDLFAPLKGGRGERSISGTNFFSAEHSIRAWIKADGCSETPAIDQLPDKADDGMTVRRTTYTSGTGGAEVVLVEIVGGGHTWPGQEVRLGILGKSTKDISANEMMWAFFKKHPMP